MKKYYFIPYLNTISNDVYDNQIAPDLKLYCLELLRPWKLITFGIGLFFLIYGALYWNFSDWNILNSLVMAILTYVLAPFTMHIFIYFYKTKKYKNNFHWLILAIIMWIFTVDTSYTLSNIVMHAPRVHIANFPASSMMFFSCGFLWNYHASFSNLIYDITHIRVVQ